MVPYAYGPIFISFIGGFPYILKIILQLIDDFKTIVWELSMLSVNVKSWKKSTQGGNFVH